VVDGQPVLLFCTNPGDDPIWIVPGPSLTGPWDMTLARPVHSPGLYAPRLRRYGRLAPHRFCHRLLHRLRR
jgi:beta-fructofuranosidase